MKHTTGYFFSAFILTFCMAVQVHADITVVPITQNPTPRNTPESNPESLVTANDASITADLHAKIVRDQDFTGTNIAVTSHGGNVILEGTVVDQNQIDKAINLAKSTYGVKTVDSHLELK